MRRGTRRKLKVYAVDAAMIFLAIQMTLVFNSGRGVRAERTENPMRREVQAVEPYCEKENAEKSIEEETETLVMSRDWGSEDAEILLRIAMAEAEGEGTVGKAHVMLVVLNRVWSDGFPETIEDVVFQEGQFTPTEDGGRYWNVTPDEECYEAYEMVLHGWDESEGALYFCSRSIESWMDDNTEYLYTVGNHNFYR